MTRDTFIDGESSGIVPLDRFSRQKSLPPNSAANASFFQQLRGLLVQDWDLDDDGRAETLRLLYATPRHWLRDGARVIVERALTDFGEVSVTAHSELSAGRVRATVDLPARQAPAKALLRLRLPDGCAITAARANGRPAPLADRETLDHSGLTGRVQVEAVVRWSPPRSAQIMRTAGGWSTSPRPPAGAPCTDDRRPGFPLTRPVAAASMPVIAGWFPWCGETVCRAPLRQPSGPSSTANGGRGLGMRTVAAWVVVAGMALATGTAAQEATDPKPVIDRALQAAGGTERLAEPRAYTFKQEMTAKSKKAPDGVVTRATYYFQPPKKFRMEEESPRGGRLSKYVEVISGNKGWAKRDGVPQQLGLQAVAHPVEVQQGFGYKFILILRDSANTAAPLGESEVGGRPVVGVKLTRPVGRGSEERRLFFDRETGLLVKSDLHARLSTGGELASEQTWGDYRTTDGIAVPHRVLHAIKNRDAATFERVYSDFKFVDKLDPQLFEKP
jgi:hypothetical protein